MLGVGSDRGMEAPSLVEEESGFSAEREAGAGCPGSAWVPVCWEAATAFGIADPSLRGERPRHLLLLTG